MAKKEGHKKKKGLKIVLFIIVGILGVLLIFALICLGNILKLKKNAKNLTASIKEDYFRQVETSIIYDINGDEITSLSNAKEIYYIEDEEIPYILKRMFVVTEDRDFYKHNGVDFSSIVRAALANLKHDQIVQGASTITQQLAKNMFLTQDVTWERKITEMFVATELEKKFTKAQILEFYINNIYFAHGHYGIESAAQGYFGKSVGELSISELAFLAAIPNNPSRYDPVTKFDQTINRRNYILKQLFADREITSLEYYEAIEEDIKLVDSADDRYDYIETYVFYCATRALMEENGFVFRNDFTDEQDEQSYNDLYDQWYSEYQASLFTGGYRIYTAIDMEKQELLQEILDDKLKEFTDVNDEGIYKTQGAAVCIDNKTGLVTAIVGGRNQDYDGYTLNRAYQSYRQPGSSIKPLIVYTPYLMLGHTPDEQIEDYPIADGPANDGDKYRGTITLTEALAWSSNVCAWKIFESETPEYGMSFLSDMNFRKTNVDKDLQAASIGGLTEGVTPVEMASAYATLENDGEYRGATCIDKITNSSGSILTSNANSYKEVYGKASSRMVTKMMEYGVEKGLLTGCQLDNAIVAAKSGTTNDSKDGWLAGYSRYYTTVVWVGNDTPSTIEGLSGGGSWPMYIWRDFMEKIHEGLEKEEFPSYEGISDSNDENAPGQSETEKETETHPGYGGGTLNISDGDNNADISGYGDKDVDVSGMGDKDAPRR